MGEPGKVAGATFRADCPWSQTSLRPSTSGRHRAPVVDEPADEYEGRVKGQSVAALRTSLERAPVSHHHPCSPASDRGRS